MSAQSIHVHSERMSTPGENNSGGVVNDIIITSWIILWCIHTLLVLRGVILAGGGGGALLSGERWSEPVLKN